MSNSLWYLHQTNQWAKLSENDIKHRPPCFVVNSNRWTIFTLNLLQIGFGQSDTFGETSIAPERRIVSCSDAAAPKEKRSLLFDALTRTQRLCGNTLRNLLRQCSNWSSAIEITKYCPKASILTNRIIPFFFCCLCCVQRNCLFFLCQIDHLNSFGNSNCVPSICVKIHERNLSCFVYWFIFVHSKLFGL